MKARSFFQGKEVRDALSYLRLLHNFADDTALDRIVNVPPRRIGTATWSVVKEDAAHRGERLWQALERAIGAADVVGGEPALHEAAEGVPQTAPRLSRAATSALSAFHSLAVRYASIVADDKAVMEMESCADPLRGATNRSFEDGDSESPLVLAGSELLARRARFRRSLWRRAAHADDSGETGGEEDGGRLDMAAGGREDGKLLHVGEGWGAAALDGGDGVGGLDGWTFEDSNATPGAEAFEKGGLARLLMDIMKEVDYEGFTRRKDDGTGRSRWAKVGELASMAAPYRVGELGLFLDQVRPHARGSRDKPSPGRVEGLGWKRPRPCQV